MHAVVFEVEMKPDAEGPVDEELDGLVGFVRSLPGFVRGTWATDGSRGLSFLVFDSEDSARGLADNAFVPPDASVVFRSATTMEILRDV
jgi:hypothetical protein